MLRETRESQHSPSVPGVFSLVDHCTPAFPCPHQCWLLSLLLALLCSAQLPPAPSCKGCRALFLPPAAFPKAPGAHRGLHLPGCCRRRRVPSPEGPPDQPRVPAACISIAVRAGLWEFLLHFFPLPSLSLSLSFWPIFVFCRGSGVFLKQLFRRRLLSDGRPVGKSSLPPAIAPPTPRSAAAARSWSRFLEQAEEHSIRGVKIVPLQPRSSRRDVRPTGLVGTYFDPPALAWGLSLHDPVWRRKLVRKRRDGFSTQPHVPVPPPCAWGALVRGGAGWAAARGACGTRLPMLGCFRRRQIRASRSSFW